MRRLLGPGFIVLWSSGFLVGAIGTRETTPLALTTWRLLIAAVLLTALAVLTRAPWPRGRRQWRDLVITGVLLQGVQFGAAYTAISMGVPAGLAALVLCLCPVLVAVFAGPVLGERLGRLGWWGSGLAVLGALVAGVDHLGSGGGGAGLGFLVLGLAGFAAGTLYQKRVGATMDLRTGTAVQMFAAAVVLAPLALLVGGGLAVSTSAAGIGSLAWLAVVNSVGGFVLLFVLLRRGTSSATSGLLYLVPPVTALLAVPVLGQPLEIQTVIGLLITLGGVLLLNRSARPAAVSAVSSRATAIAARPT
ncbi:DMT family transporter [Pseudonocardia sp. GCM10023141]|uniref:DMT family transporter n=1 Tax=Pseudonocardia sp. GCM10023141 TaxID=3252653 RepID=UPI00361D3781